MGQFTWINFYMELADKLLEYRDDRRTLIYKILSAYDEAGLKHPKLDASEAPTDIDPYTVFGTFNKGITDANRKKLIRAFAKKFEVKAAQPNDFDGVPLLNNLNATFYAFSTDSHRGKSDIDNLWLLFASQIALASNDNEQNRDAFIAAYARAVSQYGLGWKLTMGLYWARPLFFINMDSRNRWYLGDIAAAGRVVANAFPKEKDAPILDGTHYLSVCATVASQLGSDDCPQKTFPELSHAAFVKSEQVNKERKLAKEVDSDKSVESALGDADVETPRYWLYAPGENARMWDAFYDKGIMGLGWSDLGDLSLYGTKEEMRQKLVELSDGETSQKNAAHAVWQFANDLKPGDVVFAKRGRKTILGSGIVTGDYQYDELQGDYPHIRSVDWTHKGEWTCDEMFAMKTLTDMTDYPDFVAKVNSLFADDNDEVGESELPCSFPAYGRDDFLSEVYLPADKYDALVGVLRAKKNVILQGAPGVGKTYAAKRLAYSMMGEKAADRVMMVQFHQSYSYEDFIEGFRPSSDGFKLAKGAFYSFCKRAVADTDKEYFFIIDEINRGNLSKIFGELFMLIESDKRGPKNKLQLLYSHELFYVPSNVYLIGMMNTADRSLAVLDYALRRRFAFFDLKPGFASDGFAKYQASLDSRKFNGLIACVSRLNNEVTSDESLGEGFEIGHSYFCALSPADVTDAKLSAIVEYELIPTVKEYWFDDQAKVREWSRLLRESIR